MSADTTVFVRITAARLVPVLATKIEEAGGPEAINDDDIVTVANEFACDATAALAKVLYPFTAEEWYMIEDMGIVAREIARAALAALATLGYGDIYR